MINLYLVKCDSPKFRKFFLNEKDANLFYYICRVKNIDISFKELEVSEMMNGEEVDIFLDRMLIEVGVK